MPIIIASFVLLFSLTYIHGQKTTAFDKQFGDIAQAFFREPRAGYLEKPHIFERHAKQLLKLGYFLSFSLLDENNSIVKSFGLPVDQKMINNRPNDNSWITQSRHYMVLPLGERFPSEDEEENETKASILVAVDKNHQAITHFQWFFIIISMLSMCLCFAYLYYHLIRKQIMTPLNDIQLAIDNSPDPYSIRNLDLNKKDILFDLLSSLKKLLSRQKKHQESLRNQVEVTTEELKESLDSLEIKNIELDIARKQALEKNQLKSEFLANTSHELRTPLNGIIGFTDLLTKTTLSDDQKEYLSTIHDSSKSLLNIINDILDYSRLDSGTLHLEYKPFVTNTAVEQALNLQSVRANEKNIKLIYIPDINLPETLIGDSHRLQQVLAQLLSNAIKFSQGGRVTLYVHIQEQQENRVRLKFTVQDEGIGLSEEEKQKLFDSFSQLDRGDDRSYSGTGLGLSIANGLIQKMGGELGVESIKGQGSSFWFTATMTREESTQNQSLLVGSLKSVHVLVYDTDKLGRIELNNKLNTWGATLHNTKLFSQIIEKAKEILANSRKFSRFYPAAIIDAQTSQNSLDRLALKNTVTALSRELMIPTVVVCPPGKQALIKPLLNDLNVAMVYRPLQSEKLYRSIYNQIGIFNNSTTLKPALNTNQTRGEAIKVLAVDDNLANLKLVNELLRDLNTKVTIVQSGEDAIEKTQETHFDLILMDIQMPNMDGYETTKRIRKLENGKVRVPIVALTAHATGDDKIKILLCGMDDFLSKPVGSQDINHVIDRWVVKADSHIDKNLTNYMTGQFQAIPDMIENIDHLDAPSKEGRNQKELSKDKSKNKTQQKLAPVNISQSLKLAKNNASLACDMLIMLLDSFPNDLSLMKKYYTSKELSALQEVVHKIHGGACYCGVPRLLKIASKLDNNLKKKVINNLETEYKELVEAINELTEWSKEHEIQVLFGV